MLISLSTLTDTVPNQGHSLIALGQCLNTSTIVRQALEKVPKVEVGHQRRRVKLSSSVHKVQCFDHKAVHAC